MRCLYCQFKFKKLLVAGEDQDSNKRDTIYPVLCERCTRIMLLHNGHLRKISDSELEALKDSPAYKLVLEPVINNIMKQKRTSKAVN